MVLIMELATHGSLYSIIDQPENSCGLPDEEFLLVMSHLSAGLKYLRDNNIIHRDVKPSNILKTVLDTGEVLYKMCDFGAARVLAENEPFQSIVGTEEYLHPTIYNRALLGGSQSQFSANCDLWSIGVTLYHVGSGQLPFRPYGGTRGNRNAMFEMTTTKPPGVISGEQLTPNGRVIRWDKCLPQHCRLTSGLNAAVSNLLQKLMEVDKSREWSFEQFFREALSICQSIPVHFLDISSTVAGTVYIPVEQFAVKKIREMISEQLNSSDGKNREEVSVFWEGKRVQDCDETDLLRALKLQNSAANPMTVLRQDSNLQQFKTPSIAECLSPKAVVASDHLDLTADVEVAKKACVLGHWVKRYLQSMTEANHHLYNVPSSILANLKDRISTAEYSLGMNKKLWNCVLIQLDALRRCSEISDDVKLIVNRKENSGTQISAASSQLESDFLSLKSELITLRRDSTMSSIPKTSTNCTTSVPSVKSASQICDSLEEIFMQFKKDRSLKIDSSPNFKNETNWHNLKKKQLIDCVEKLEISLKGEDSENLKSTHHSVIPELNKLMNISDRLRKIENDLDQLTGMIDAFQETVSQVLNHMDSEVSRTNGTRKSVLTNGTTNMRNTDVTTLVMKLVETTQDLRSETQKNSELLGEIFQD